MSSRKASDLFVECLEAEGVKYVFGIPGEETLDLNESLQDSSIAFVPVRHEQGGAYMADMYGRLTGRAGRLPGHARPGRDEPDHRRRRRLPGPLAAGRADRPGGPRAHAQGVPPAHRHRLDVQAGDEVEHAPERGGRDPRGRAQGVQGRPGAQAGPDPHRAARGRDGRQRSTPSRCPRSPHTPPPGAERRRPAGRRRADRQRDQPDHPGRQRRRPRRCGARAARAGARHRDRRGRDVHGQGRARLRGPARARHRRAAVARLRAGGLRGRRRGHHGRLRPRRALAVELEPEAQQEDRLHRQRPVRGRRELHHRDRPRSATSTTSSAA